jgi:hypothetical protein
MSKNTTKWNLQKLLKRTLGNPEQPHLYRAAVISGSQSVVFRSLGSARPGQGVCKITFVFLLYHRRKNIVLISFILDKTYFSGIMVLK